MSARKVAKEYKLLKWSEIMRKRYDSGESVRSWCRNNGISDKTFYYWRRMCKQQKENSIDKKAQ